MKRTIDNARPGCVEENGRQVQMHLVWLRERAIRRDQHSRYNSFGYVQAAIPGRHSGTVTGDRDE